MMKATSHRTQYYRGLPANDATSSDEIDASALREAAAGNGAVLGRTSTAPPSSGSSSPLTATAAGITFRQVPGGGGRERMKPLPTGDGAATGNGGTPTSLTGPAGNFFLRLAKGEYDFKLSALSAESLILITQSQ